MSYVMNSLEENLLLSVYYKSWIGFRCWALQLTFPVVTSSEKSHYEAFIAKDDYYKKYIFKTVKRILQTTDKVNYDSFY